MPLVTLTEMASEKVKELIESGGHDGYSLRLKVVGGGCNGLQYQLMFDDAIDDLDQETDSNGVHLVVDAKSAVYVVGATIDYVEDATGSGFRVNNPNAVNTCCCGDSFEG